MSSIASIAAIEKLKADGNHFVSGKHWQRAIDRYSDAINHCQQLMKTDSSTDYSSMLSILHGNICHCYMQLNTNENNNNANNIDYSVAIYHCRQSLKYNPSYVKSQSRLALLMYLTENYESAYTGYKNILLKDSTNDNAKEMIKKIEKKLQETNQYLKNNSNNDNKNNSIEDCIPIEYKEKTDPSMNYVILDQMPNRGRFYRSKSIIKAGTLIMVAKAAAVIRLSEDNQYDLTTKQLWMELIKILQEKKTNELNANNNNNNSDQTKEEKTPPIKSDKKQMIGPLDLWSNYSFADFKSTLLSLYPSDDDIARLPYLLDDNEEPPTSLPHPDAPPIHPPTIRSLVDNDTLTDWELYRLKYIIRYNSHTISDRTHILANIKKNNNDNNNNTDLLYGSALFPLASYFNHSCMPNAHSYTLSLPSTNNSIESGNYLFIRALRDINAGEEITISYIVINQSVKQRRKLLYERYDFICDCPRCDWDKYTNNNNNNGNENKNNNNTITNDPNKTTNSDEKITASINSSSSSPIPNASDIIRAEQLMNAIRCPNGDRCPGYSASATRESGWMTIGGTVDNEIWIEAGRMKKDENSNTNDSSSPSNPDLSSIDTFYCSYYPSCPTIRPRSVIESDYINKSMEQFYYGSKLFREKKFDDAAIIWDKIIELRGKVIHHDHYCWPQILSARAALAAKRGAINHKNEALLAARLTSEAVQITKKNLTIQHFLLIPLILTAARCALSISEKTAWLRDALAIHSICFGGGKLFFVNRFSNEIIQFGLENVIEMIH